jgi:hypothetical protein
VNVKTLAEVAKLVRSKNAGPFWLTLDVMFDDVKTYEAVRDQHVLNVGLISRLFGQSPEHVSVFAHDAALAIKVSLPRPYSSGSPMDTDVFGGQQYAPLLDLPVQIESEDTHDSS